MRVEGTSTGSPRARTGRLLGFTSGSGGTGISSSDTSDEGSGIVILGARSALAEEAGRSLAGPWPAPVGVDAGMGAGPGCWAGLWGTTAAFTCSDGSERPAAE